MLPYVFLGTKTTTSFMTVKHTIDWTTLAPLFWLLNKHILQLILLCACMWEHVRQSTKAGRTEDSQRSHSLIPPYWSWETKKLSGFASAFIHWTILPAPYFGFLKFLQLKCYRSKVDNDTSCPSVYAWTSRSHVVLTPHTQIPHCTIFGQVNSICKRTGPRGHSVHRTT